MTAWKPDPVIAELRAVKDAYAAEFDFDIDAICDHLVAVEKTSGRDYVSRPPRRVAAEAPVICTPSEPLGNDDGDNPT